jgi:arylsulfatase A-like enzyme
MIPEIGPVSDLIKTRSVAATLRRLLGASALLMATASIGVSCWREAEPAPPPNFVLIVIDTLRADRLGFAGHESVMPTFDRLRSESTYFPNALSTSSWTLPATASLFLSQYPSQHGVTAWASHLADEPTTLVEVLRSAGYRTAGWSANRLITEKRGFRRGFDTFELVSHPQWKFGTPSQSPYAFAFAEDLISKALAWLEESSTAEGEDPFFLYLHFMEPHSPYLCPPAAGDECRKAAMNLNRHLAVAMWNFDGEEASLISGLYNSDLRRMDAALDQLYRALAEGGFLENTWLILTSDHGEMLGEHDLYIHGNALYEETLRVPLIIRPPNPREAIESTPVSLIDIAPTILEAAGIEPPTPFKGRSLYPALEARPLHPRPILGELLPVRDEKNRHYRHLLSVTSGSTKLVLGVDGVLERFDLSEDPGEEVPLPAEMSELEARLSEAGVDFRHLEALGASVPELSPDVIEELRGLGYIHE